MNIYEFIRIGKLAGKSLFLSLVSLESFAAGAATVTYRDFAMTAYDLKAGRPLFIEGYVKNTGDQAVEEVVQVYLNYPAQSSEAPMQLKASEKLLLEPGIEKRAILYLSPKDYSFWSPGNGSWMVYPGEYQVLIGPSSDDIRFTKPLNVRGGSLEGTVYQAEDVSLASMDFPVVVPSSGAYRVSLRYANGNEDDRSLSIYVNGEKVRETVLPILANWETWNYKTESLYLNEGQNTISYRYDEGDSSPVNLDGIIVNESPNLALNKEVSASSAESEETPVQYAVDGDPETRWSSSFSDPQWFQIDLGESFIIDSVVLKWEESYARTYTIEGSLDGKDWERIYYTGDGDGNEDEVNGLNTKIIPDQTRYLRLNTTERGTEFGVSLWDLEVYGASAATAPWAFYLDASQNLY